MALSRKMLKAMSISEEQIDEIIEAHTETVNALKEERDEFKAQADKVPTLQKELGELKENAEKNEGKNPYKVKYDALKEEFDNYKADIDKKEVKALKKDAYKELLNEVGISEKRIGVVLRASDPEIDSIELDKDGKIKDSDKLVESIKKAWGDFIETNKTLGAPTATPPANVGGGKMTKDQILAIKDTAERQKAMFENKELFFI